MATTHLTRTTSGTPTSSKKCTFSTWIKFSEAPQGSGSDRWIFGEHDNNSNHSYLYLRNSSAIGWYETSSGAILSKITTRLFRDLNSWYHIQVIMDTTDSTAEDRWKLYVNGERITSWSTNSPSAYNSDHDVRVNRTGKNIYIGGVPSYQTHFNGLMSHTHFCDGTALAPTVFGSTDNTTGEWQINTSPSFTPGTNGFTILKDGNTITDQSANSNNFSLGAGTLTKTEDCPSNVFPTMNPLDSYWMGATYSNGNNKALTQGSHMTSMAATLGASSGKYYWEVKADDVTGQMLTGIDTKGASSCTNFSSGQCIEYTGERPYAWGYRTNGKVYNNDSNVNYGNTYTNNDIIGVALDLDNNKIYWSKNGTWQNSGDPTSGSTGTGAISITASSSTDTGFYFPAFSDNSTSSTITYSTNFGNGYFGTTAVSSAGTNASGNGIFEYDVPTGYTALSTKGLNL